MSNPEFEIYQEELKSKNNKRDSVWTVFSKEGRIITQQTFRNDTLLTK